MIFNTKLEVIPSDILSAEEFSYVVKIQSHVHTKVSLSYKDSLVVLTLKIPSLLNYTYAKIVFEPITDKQNKSLIIKDNTILVHKDNVCKADTVEYKKLTKRDDECLTNIMNDLEPKCIMNVWTSQEEKEIFPGLIIFWKNYENKITTNCKHWYNFENIKTYVLKFKNCILKTKIRTKKL